MDGLKLKEELYALKDRLDKVEVNLRSQIAELTTKEKKLNVLDEIAERKKKTENLIIKFNICGKKFMTKVATLLSTKDTLFYKMIISGEVNLHEEIFFDRSPKYFSFILDFLRTKKINLKRFKKKELENLHREADYFEISDLLDLIGDASTEIEFVSYEMNMPYTVSGTPVGTNKIEDINDSSRMKGICASSPGWIIIQLNTEWSIKGMDIGGYAGNPSLWSSENGAYASIKVSTDKLNWTQVGTIPSGYGSAIKTVTFGAVSALYIKFEYTSYLGIGYLKLNHS
jgi:hypothetical protein